jgi:hypothetical protein
MAETTSMAAWRERVEAFWKKLDRQHAVWLLAVALGLILITIVVAVWRTAALTVLFLAPVGVCLVVALLWPDAREWLIENTLPLGALLLSGWLLGAFVLWVVVNAVWAGQAQRVAGDHTTLTVDNVSLTAAIDYPAVALADAADNTLRFSFSADTTAPLPRQVLTATITLSDTLAFATAGGPPTRDFIVPLTTAQPGSQRIGVINSGVYGGWRGREATIAVRLCDGGGSCVDDLVLTVRPEGRNGYAIRRFVNSTIDQSSPIILLLLFVVPGLALWAQRVVDERRKELRAQRAEECDQIIADFRGYLCAPQANRAADALSKLQKPRYRHFKKYEIKLAAQLFQLTTLIYPLPRNPDDPFWDEWPDSWITRSGPEWPREFVTAGLTAQRRLSHPKLQTDYQKLYGAAESPVDFEYYFEVYVVPQLRAFLHRVWAAIRRIPLAADDELFAERERMDQQRRKDDVRSRPVLHAVPRPYTPRSHGLAVPFAWGDASRTEEIKFLTDGQAFWGNHPILKNLRHGDHSVIVRGAAGSGRTALAAVLPLAYVNDPADLFVHVTAGSTREQIIAAIAEQLLHFVLRQPAFLSRRAPEQRQKLARFLATWLEPDRLMTPMQARLEGLWQALEAAGDDTQQRESRISYEELEQFRQLLSATGGVTWAALDTVNWPNVFLESLHILEFWNVVFVIRLERPRLDWLMALGNFTTLYELGIHFWLFVEDDLQGDILLNAPYVAYDLRLAWEDNHLPYFRAMLDWRFEKYLDAAKLRPRRERRRALVTCFEGGETDLDRLIKAAKVDGEYNPRRFMLLWRAAVGDKEDGRLITAADVDRALAEGGDR